MKRYKKIAAITAAAMITIGALSGCKEEYDPEDNENACVYGPPSVFGFDDEQEEPEDIDTDEAATDEAVSDEAASEEQENDGE